MTSVRKISPSSLDPHLQSVADHMAGAQSPAMVDSTPEQARELVRMAQVMCAPGPELWSVESHDVNPHVSVRIYRPERTLRAGTLVHFHGGGWVTGDLDYADAFCREAAAAAGVPVVSVEYRLAPESPFPAAVDDALAAVRWVVSEHTDLSPRLIVMGDSAGGNLAAVCAHVAANDPSLSVAGQVLIYPVLDCDLGRPSYLENSNAFLGRDEMQWFFDHYCPDPDVRQSDRVSPVRAGSFADLPPTVLAVGGHDPLRDEGVEYAQKLADSGVPVTLLEFPSLPHAFLQFTAATPEARSAATEIVSAVTALLDRTDR